MRKITIAIMKKAFLYIYFFIGIFLWVAIIMVGELKLNGSITVVLFSPQRAQQKTKIMENISAFAYTILETMKDFSGFFNLLNKF